MDRTNILLAGLPSAGKSTYITALWAVEQDEKSGHLLTCDGRPSESSYIDGMNENWLLLKEVRRTTFAEPMEIDLPMKRSLTGEKINLSLPDFKGEIFQKVIENTVSEVVTDWCEKSNGILFMAKLGNSSPAMLQEQVTGNTNPKVEIDKVVMTTNDIDPVIQNVLLLKFLFNRMGDCPIAICLSSWDKSDCMEGTDVEDWVKENHPCIYNYVKEHFSHYKYFGVSAQGADYEGLSDEMSDELAEKAERKERAYIYTDSVSYDITSPIDFLITEAL